MLSKLSAAFAVFAITTQVVVASPPACLLKAVNTQDNPHDIKGVCSGDAAKEVAKAMDNDCGDAKDTATEWFASVCKDAGVTISTSTSSSSDSSSTKSASKSSSTGSADSSSTAASMTASESSGIQTAAYPLGTASSGFQTATTNGSLTAPTASAPTTTGADAPSSTGAASRMGMDILGMAAVGIFGAMIAL